MNDTITTLKEGIEAVFADVTYPGDDNLTSNYNPLSINNDEGVADYFRQTSWRGHSVQNLRYYSCALSFFTPAAFHYYLPAFIIADIEDPVEADVISDSIIFDFTPSTSLLRLHSFDFTPSTSLLRLHSFDFTPSTSLLRLQARWQTESVYFPNLR